MSDPEMGYTRVCVGSRTVLSHMGRLNSITTAVDRLTPVDRSGGVMLLTKSPLVKPGESSSNTVPSPVPSLMTPLTGFDNTTANVSSASGAVSVQTVTLNDPEVAGGTMVSVPETVR